ncbi:hypothetical protein VNO78_18404 [Psophocarpus tetragonolobus]|uniref:Uncharacterized protein n=1 Tax=Psophocarpus tetragonolobus TaxID=3891 RepID=A0AAN9SJD8_PSOTE
MEQREFNLSICHKLYHFIMKTLASQAMKTVTLGKPLHYGSSSTKVQITNTQRGFGTKEDKVVPPGTPCPCRIIDADGNELVAEDLPHAPKKMVNINHNVEEIILPGKKRSKSLQNSNPLEQQEHPKPLRSILKVRANLNHKSK